MNKAVVRLYSLLVALTLVGLLAWAGTDWYQLRLRAEAQAHENLRRTAGTITDWTIQDSQRRPEVLSAIFRQGLLTDLRWKALVLVSGNTTTEYYWGPRTAVDPMQVVPAWSPRPLFEVASDVRVFTPSGQPWQLNGVYQFYGTAEILSLLRASGLTLLVLLVLTTVLLLFQAGRRDEEPEVQPKDDDLPPPDFGDDEGPVPMTADVGSDEPERDEYWFDDDLTLEDLPPLETPAATDSAPAAAQAAAPAAGPSMLAPSGLGWSHFLEDRLTFELERCSSNNQDLTLLRLGAVSLPDSGLATAFAQEVQAFFGSADLNFEANTDFPGAVIVLPARSLEQGLAEAQAFISRMDRTLPQLKVCAGAASRTGRLLSATTLIGEATSALKRARAGTTRAIGLKTDPDRYREHLARRASAE